MTGDSFATWNETPTQVRLLISQGNWAIVPLSPLMMTFQDDIPILCGSELEAICQICFSGVRTGSLQGWHCGGRCPAPKPCHIPRLGLSWESHPWGSQEHGLGLGDLLPCHPTPSPAPLRLHCSHCSRLTSRPREASPSAQDGWRISVICHMAFLERSCVWGREAVQLTGISEENHCFLFFCL